jgi:transposase-like protein
LKVFDMAREILDAIGFDNVIERIEAGESYAEIARTCGCSPGVLRAWLHETEERSKRSAQAQKSSAEAWLDKGTAILEAALRKSGDIDPTAARALASEYARRAAQRDPAYHLEKQAPQVAVQINNAPPALKLPDVIDQVAASKAYAELIGGPALNIPS